MRIERELMRGAGPAAVMRLLQGGERYGYEMIELLERQTAGVLAMGQSTLYPLLYNLEAKGWITARIEIGPNGRTRKYYRLTAKGQKTADRGVPAVGVRHRRHGQIGRDWFIKREHLCLKFSRQVMADHSEGFAYAHE